MAQHRGTDAGPVMTTPIMTTLYDVIAVLEALVAPDEEDLITAIVINLINTGRLTFLGEHKHCQIVCV